uniref:Similar to n=1 Tax=Panagrellus redivivus TaxID=6233 RepID=A0A7E4W7H2_PANRE
MIPSNGVIPGSSGQHYAPSGLHENHQQDHEMYSASDFRPPPSDTQPTNFQPPPLSSQFNPQMYYDPLSGAGNYLSQGAQQFANFQTATGPAVPSDSINFITDEALGRASDEEFPEYVPGAWDEIRKQRVLTPGKPSMRFRTELDASDVKLVNELGQLSVDNLLDYMKNLQNNAYVLGEEEAKEFQRSKNLGFYKK